MTAKSIDRYSTCSAARISMSLLLTVLLLFPDGVALAQTACSSTWSTSTHTLVDKIETLNAVVNNGYLYSVGGYATSDGVDTVGYVALNSDGTLQSNFNPTTHLPKKLSRDLCGVAYNGYLYAIGGVEYPSGGHGTTTQAVRRAPFNPGGTIGSWTWQATALHEAVQLHGSVILNGYLYIIGGSLAPDDQNVYNYITEHVWYAKIKSDGSVQLPFKAGPDLPVQLYKTCPVVLGNVIYMSGGESTENLQTDTSAVNTVYYATQNQDGSGTLSAWNTTQTGLDLPQLLASQAVAYNNGIILMGGDDTGEGGDTNVTLKGAVDQTHNTISWSYLSNLPSNRSRNAGATYGQYVYSVGGLVQGADSNAVACLKP